MNRPIFALLALFASAQLLAADTYVIDSRHTWPVFEVNHLGFSTQRGRFNRTSGKIVVDVPARKGSIEVEIDAASIDMGLDDWDEHMKSPDYFNVAKYPTITFKSDRLLFEGEKLVGAEGTLTLLGVSRPVKLSVENFRCGTNPMNKRQVCGADVSATIRRSEFGMKTGLPAVGDEVRILIPVEAFRE
ncbi:MAG: YceI family protein [Pseudomonadota bacterium]|jgi:Uncharacterized conserved protein|nr:MAG: polyisoprenoid-binding protein [Pseudomonadota bacterium]